MQIMSSPVARIALVTGIAIVVTLAFHSHFNLQGAGIPRSIERTSAAVPRAIAIRDATFPDSSWLQYAPLTGDGQ
jgi:hypothetical protein